MERTIGVDKARARLSQLAEEVAADDQPIVLTRRGQALAILVSPAEYNQLIEDRRRHATEQLRISLVNVRQSVADAGLDVSLVDDAITAARAIE